MTGGTTTAPSWLAAPAASAPLLDCAQTSAGIAVVDGWWTTLLA